MVRKLLLIALAVAGLVLAVAYVRGRVCERLDVLYGFEDAAQLRQTLKAEVYYSIRFAQGGTNYVGVMVSASKYHPILLHTLFFHQAAPFYVFDGDGRKIDFSRNHNDDGAFHRRWSSIPYGSEKWRHGWVGLPEQVRE